MASRSFTIPGRVTPTSASKTRQSQTAKAKSEVSNINTPRSTQPLKKRKREIVDLTQEEDEVAAAAANAALAGNTPPIRRKKVKGEAEEKRLRSFRKKAPRTFLERLDRVRTQRMFLIDRSRLVSRDGTHEEEVFDIAGTTGNIYQVTISKEPSCTCPDAGKGNQCKHIIYVLVNVLKAPEDLSYQFAFLSAELREIFVNAPVTPQSFSQADPTSTDTGGFRKPIEGNCPVCVMEFDSSGTEEIVWCKAACGNNIHRQCFEQWAKSKPGQVKCVYCRTAWKGDGASLKGMSVIRAVNEEGYVNVASQLGLSGRRDMSSYHQPWFQRQYGGTLGRYR